MEGTELVVNTSSISGTPFGISTNVELTIYSRYNLKTNSADFKINNIFANAESNWASSYFDGHLILTDTEQKQFVLLQAKGQLIQSRPARAGDMYSRLVGYDNGLAYTLVWANDKVKLIEEDMKTS
ncbi:hypothetical protein [Paenibacillus sp. MMS18-CY102]|uniref:hypothetical protein n=1 Tax=Paenibacillus sp. MMS18-CY102 TaxID=2682849 RepID=UPI0013661C18|nr:hypothetical protein [Paenibacillus sp. MMS18-CY102]MWC29856.1 hypothetical protein [Paenibacillus sp. MMS18-CY102]